MTLTDNITSLAGIGPARAESFAKFHVHTIEELLYLFPRTYEDHTKLKEIKDCLDGDNVCIRVRTSTNVREARIRKGMSIYSVSATDDTGTILLLWFNNRFIKNQIKPYVTYTLYGKISYGKRGIQMQNPSIEATGDAPFNGQIVPIYPITKGLLQKTIQKTERIALDAIGTLEETLPTQILKEYNIAEINYAMQNIHFPESFEAFKLARKRFVFEELFTLQAALLQKKTDTDKATGYKLQVRSAKYEVTGEGVTHHMPSERIKRSFPKHPMVCGVGHLMQNGGFICDNIPFVQSLPFPLTNAQKRTVDEILSDMATGVQMSRLVQGDVGSGKTVVAAIAMYVAVKNGYQAAIMAPTEILASQHADSLNELFAPYGLRVAFLSGSTKQKDRKTVLKAIAEGEADIIVGTNAIIQDSVTYKHLALVVADEQHRFGVAQRTKLISKGNSPHMLVMSATPIPRTLALILYGDLSVSIIDELPPGRKPIKTYAVGENMRSRVYAFMEKTINEGGQCYVVCPLVEESEAEDLKNATEHVKKLQESYPNIRIGLMHGRLSQQEKDAVMSVFAGGDLDVLVSTTVIEVGVNVPRANLMIIENAERFGLSQLHQLRGRVGRGNTEAYCILFAHGNNDVTKKRMKTMCESNDGFYISEQDLKLRGPGDFFGTRQHGLPEMKIANLFEDADILSMAQSAVQALRKEDPTLSKWPKLKEKIQSIYDEAGLLN